MSVLNTLEKHLGRFAIPGLIRMIVALTAATYVLSLANPSSMNALILDGPAILSGEIWRLVTWPFLPPTITFFGINLPIFVQVILMVFVLQCFWTFGEILESAWGAFRVNAFIFLGMAGCIATALLFQIGGAYGITFTANFTLTLLFAVATVAPDFELLLYMVLPVRIKWIAWIALAFLLLQFVTASWLGRLATVLSFVNCLVFLVPSLARMTRTSREVVARRAKFKAAQFTAETLHRCETCGRTEVSHPELDFRVSADGHEYCTEHLPARRNS
jgi:hypothetical protein